MEFSYGSGLSSTWFNSNVVSSLEKQKDTCNLFKRLESRTEVEPKIYSQIMDTREKFYNKTNFELRHSESLLPKESGTFVLKGIDKQGKRSYERIGNIVSKYIIKVMK